MANATQPQLTVAILAGEDQAWQRTVTSVLESARLAQARVEVFVAWSGITVPAAGELGPVPIRTMLGLGPAYVKNRVLDDAEARLVGFVDAGTEVGPDWVCAVVRSFDDTPKLAMTFAPASGRGDGTSLTKRLRRGAALGQLMASFRTNLAVRREVAIGAGGFYLQIGAGALAHTHEDLDLGLRLIKSGAAVACCGAMSHVNAGPPRRHARESAARQVGAIARRNRSFRLCGLFITSLPGTRMPEAVTDLRAFAGGLVTRPRNLSPTEVLGAMPAAVRELLGEMPIEPLHASRPPKTHLMYAAGDELLLHVYPNPSARLRRSLRERQSIRSRVGLPGIPALHVAAEGTDALWVVEDRLRGAHPVPEEASAWFDQVAEWAVQFAGGAGPPLRTSPEWREHRDAILALCPRAVYPQMAEALESAAGLPSVHMHGDFQRRNLLLTNTRVGLVDWEGAWFHGLPGLDLVFLALLARSDAPDASVIDALLAGTDPPFGRLALYLARVGVSEDALRPALLAMLGLWILGEDRRLRRQRAPASSPRPYRELLLRRASSFAV